MHDPADKRKAFAKRVKVLRAQLGLTQDELAQKIGVRRQTISQWALGINTPHEMHLAKFEELERTLASDPNGANVTAILEDGVSHLRQWLLGYTGRVLHAQADAFVAASAADPEPIEAGAMPLQKALPAPPRSARG